MDIQFFGLTALRVRGKKTSIVFDPANKQRSGVDMEKVDADAVCLTTKDSPYIDLGRVDKFRVLIEGPGEYEVGGASIVGIAINSVTTYSLKMDEVLLLHLGSIAKAPSEEVLERYGSPDVLFVPVGGHGSLDGREAGEVVAKLEPHIVVPINFEEESLKIKLDPIEPFLKEVGKEAKPLPKLTVTKERLPDEMEVVWLT